MNRSPLMPEHQLFPVHCGHIQHLCKSQCSQKQRCGRKGRVRFWPWCGWGAGGGWGRRMLMGKLARLSLFGHCAPKMVVATWFCLVSQTCVCQTTNVPGPHSAGPIFSSALMGHVCWVLPNHKNNHTLVAGGLCLAHRPSRAAWACTQPPPG